MKLGRILFAACLILVAAAGAFGQGAPTQLSTQKLTLLPQAPVPLVTTVRESPSIQGTATYYYWFVSKQSGIVSPPAGPFPVYNAPATLGGIYTITVNWTPAPGVTTYDVLRTATTAVPSGSCACAVITGTAGTALVDNSPSTVAYTVATSASQVPAVLTNVNTGNGSGGGGSNTLSQVNIKTAPYNATGNTQSFQVQYTEAGGAGDCPASVAECLIGTPNLVTISDIGKTLWTNENASGINRTLQGTINGVYSSTEFSTTVTSSAFSGLGSTNTMVWGTDDTAAIQAAIAAANASSFSVYLPCGNYIISSQLTFTVPAIGESTGCVTFWPTPSFTDTTSDEGMIYLTDGGENFTINGSSGNISSNQTNTAGILEAGGGGGSPIEYKNIQAVRLAVLNGAGSITVSASEATLINTPVVQNPSVGQNNPGCFFRSAQDTTVIGIFCSNGSIENLGIQGIASGQHGGSLRFFGGLVDECGLNVAGGACTEVVGSQDVYFYGTVLTGGDNNANDGLSVDGTSSVYVVGSDVGPFNLNSGGAISVASGGQVRVSNSFLHCSGTSAVCVTNNGSYFDLGGNSLTLASGATSYSGSSGMFGSASVTGTTQTAANVTLTSGWSTSTVDTPSGNSQREQFTISVAGTPSAGPSLTVNFPTSFLVAPICTAQDIGGTNPSLSESMGTVLAGSAIIDFTGTPTAGDTITTVLTCSN